MTPGDEALVEELLGDDVPRRSPEVSDSAPCEPTPYANVVGRRFGVSEDPRSGSRVDGRHGRLEAERTHERAVHAS